MEKSSEIHVGSRSFKLETKVFEGGVVQSEITDLAGQIMRRVLNTQEQHIREGLINLGWTPPPEIDQ